MTLEVGRSVRVRKFGGHPITAVVIRDEGETVRVRFVASGKERTIQRSSIVGAPPTPRLPGLEKVPNRARAKPSPAQFKAPPVRDAKYLDHVRRRPCCICAAPPPSDAHHYGPRGFGQKTDDRRTVPLCRPCHDVWHARRGCPPYTSVETQREFYRAQVDALLAYDPRSG